jgi:acyl-CoA synthetase (NDP forming)
MSIRVDDALFRPRGIAVVGASNDPAKLSGRPLDYLLRLGYRGAIYAVNPNRTEVQGVRSYRSIGEVPGPVDLAVVVVPASAVIQALEDCASAGVAAAVVFASGFGEVGGLGAQLQAEITRVVRDSGMRVVGPNCLGTFALSTAAFATFSSAFDEQSSFPDDPIALVSQSGAVGTFLFSTLVGQHIGVRYFANTGNEVDVTVGELLRGLAQAPDVRLLVGYMEDARSLPAVEAAALEARRHDKPLILLKAGLSAPGTRAVRYHTASNPGDSETFGAFVSRLGIVWAQSMEGVADALMTFRSGRRCKRRRLAIISMSGGAAALATDAAAESGLEVNEPDADRRTSYARMLPAFGSSANPFDLTGGLLNEPVMLENILRAVATDDSVDMILVVMGNADRGSEALVKGIRDGYAATAKPFAVAWTGGSGRPRLALQEAGIPTYAEPLRAVRALAQLANYCRAREGLDGNASR